MSYLEYNSSLQRLLAREYTQVYTSSSSRSSRDGNNHQQARRPTQIKGAARLTEAEAGERRRRRRRESAQLRRKPAAGGGITRRGPSCKPSRRSRSFSSLLLLSLLLSLSLSLSRSRQLLTCHISLKRCLRCTQRPALQLNWRSASEEHLGETLVSGKQTNECACK